MTSNFNKHRSGRQRKAWGRVVDELSALDKHEWMEDIRRGKRSLASFLVCIEESVSKREGKLFEEGLNSIDMYKRFGKERGICMGLVMQELDYCLSLGQGQTV